MAAPGPRVRSTVRRAAAPQVRTAAGREHHPAGAQARAYAGAHVCACMYVHMYVFARVSVCAHVCVHSWAAAVAAALRGFALGAERRGRVCGSRGGVGGGCVAPGVRCRCGACAEGCDGGRCPDGRARALLRVSAGAAGAGLPGCPRGAGCGTGCSQGPTAALPRVTPRGQPGSIPRSSRVYGAEPVAAPSPSRWPPRPPPSGLAGSRRPANRICGMMEESTAERLRTSQIGGGGAVSALSQAENVPGALPAPPTPPHSVPEPRAEGRERRRGRGGGGGSDGSRDRSGARDRGKNRYTEQRRG